MKISVISSFNFLSHYHLPYRKGNLGLFTSVNFTDGIFFILNSKLIIVRIVLNFRLQTIKI